MEEEEKNLNRPILIGDTEWAVKEGIPNYQRKNGLFQ